MTKKHFQLIADEFRFAYAETVDPAGRDALRSMARNMAKRLSRENARFDVGRFLAACAVEAS